MTEEQENFYRHCTVIVDVIKYLFLQLIEFYFKNQNFTTFEDFIRKYQHEIYHFCYYRYKCCNCPSGMYRQGSKVLYHEQMALLLDTSGPKLRCHNINSSSNPNCCCQVKPGITVQLLDISLARTLLVNYLVPQCAQERKAIDELVRIRNLSYGHATSGRMSNDEFKQSIENITKSVMILARLCNKETEIKQMLSDSLRQPLNPAVCTQLHTTLLQQIEREDKIEQDLKEIKSALEDQKSSKDVDISDTFLSLLGKQEVYEGQDARFECKVTTIKVQGKWFKDGDQICDSQNVHITQKGRELCLNIYGTGLHDRGEYSCVVNGRETKAFLDVRAFFTITLRDKSCYEGDTITFTCEVIDLLTTSQWFKDGANIDNGRYVIKTHQLTIKYANLCDRGRFGVDVNGRCRQASLEVIACFITDIKSISCIEGQNVSFSCLIKPRDAVIQWFHSNREIKSSEKYSLQCDNKSKSLEIRNVDIGDSGTIAIRVKNCSRACTLDVRKCFLKELDSITITEGYDVQFACEVNCQKVIGTWYKDDEEIENSDKFVIQRSGKKNSLVVNNTSLDDNGTYSFKVHHKVTEASLDVRGYFRKNPTNVTCKEGEVVHITCESIESCIPAQWCKDGMDIDFNNDKFSIKQNRTEYQLTIRSASKKDNGCYSVNVNGRIRMADVSVRDYFTMSMDDITCKTGDTAQFKCEAKENGMIVKWFKDNDEIQSDRYKAEQKGNGYQLTIRNVDTTDSGSYSISVNGRTRTAILIVEERVTKKSYPERIIDYFTGSGKLKNIYIYPDISIEQGSQILDVLSYKEKAGRAKLDIKLPTGSKFKYFSKPQAGSEFQAELVNLYVSNKNAIQSKGGTEKKKQNNNENVVTRSQTTTIDMNIQEQEKSSSMAIFYRGEEAMLKSYSTEELKTDRETLRNNTVLRTQWTNRTKMKNSKVRTQSKPVRELKIYLQSEVDFAGLVDEYFEDNIIRQAVYEFFCPDVTRRNKTSFDRSNFPWPSMHPLLPYKYRYLDENEETSHGHRNPELHDEVQNDPNAENLNNYSSGVDTDQYDSCTSECTDKIDNDSDQDND